MRAIGAFPTPGADATSGHGVTRTIVHAFAMRVTIDAVKTLRALCFASNSSPFWLAVAATGCGIAVHAVLVVAVASLIAPVPEETLFTTILTECAGETSRTRARAVLWIARRIVKALALALAILPVGLVVARTVAQHADPSGGAVAASVFRRAASSVLAGAFLRAILAEGVHRAQLAAVGSTVSGRADAGAVHWRALRVVLAVAAILAILAIRIKGTWSRASLAVPAHLAGALSCPGMTQLRVLALALANLPTIGPVQTVLALALVAGLPCPAMVAYAGTIDGIAGSTVLAGAVGGAVQPEFTLGTDRQAFVADKSRLALALARDMIATGSVVAVADLRAVLAPETLRASIRAHRTRPARRAVALASRGTARTAILTLAL